MKDLIYIIGLSTGQNPDESGREVSFEEDIEMMSLGNSATFHAKQNATTAHETANQITTTIGGGLSMIGATIIIFSYLKIEEARRGGAAAKILLCISLADFLSAASSVIGVWSRSSGKGCETEGFLIIFSITASFFWTSCLTIHLFLVMVNQNGPVGSRKLMICFHSFSWGLPLLLATVALGAGALGPSPSLPTKEYIKLTTGGWCWIKEFNNTSETVVWTLMTSKAWELVSYLLITVLCFLVLCHLHFKLSTSVEVDRNTLIAAKKVERRMMFIPVAFVLLRVWGTIRYFAYVSNLHVREDILESVLLYALQGLGDTSQGLANSAFFLLSNKRVYNYWKKQLFSVCSFLCNEEDLELGENSPLIQDSRQLNVQAKP